MDDTIRELTLPLGLDPVAWQGSFNGSECSLHQLAPYVGKLKTGMVQSILNEFSDLRETVLDPFCGAGVVPLQSLLQGRRACANDLSDYAYAVTLGKLAAPPSLQEALEQVDTVLDDALPEIGDVRIDDVPEWVQAFFDPATLRETLAVFRSCERLNYPFVRACMLGILHHVRPGFLSYPASHLTPYLRAQKYPPADYPEMYGYRDVSSRLRAKAVRAYRRPSSARWTDGDYTVTQCNAMSLPNDDESIDCIVSSPPYFGALDYARDNRLRLWFLGVEDWRSLDKSLTANSQVYLPQMRECLREMHRVLRTGRHCILILGDVSRDGRIHRTAEIIAEEAIQLTNGGFSVERLVADTIPDERRSRRRTRTTKIEKILVLKKRYLYPRPKRTPRAEKVTAQ